MLGEEVDSDELHAAVAVGGAIDAAASTAAPSAAHSAGFVVPTAPSAEASSSSGTVAGSYCDALPSAAAGLVARHQAAVVAVSACLEELKKAAKEVVEAKGPWEVALATRATASSAYDTAQTRYHDAIRAAQEAAARLGAAEAAEAALREHLQKVEAVIRTML